MVAFSAYAISLFEIWLLLLGGVGVCKGGEVN